MRKLFFILLLMLALPALLFSSLEVGSGYVLIAVGDKTIEMGFLVALVLNTLIFITLYFAIVLLRSLFSTRRGVLGWAKNQRQQRGFGVEAGRRRGSRRGSRARRGACYFGQLRQ